jgi:cytochrome c oxidase subunit 2
MRTLLLAAAAGVFAAAATAGAVLSQTPDEPVIRITAKRFNYEPAQINLVRGRPVILELVSLDRTHGFRVPQLNIRTEIPEGSSTRVRVVPEQAGHFFFACDVFCGSGHEEMEGDIVVTEQ